MIDFAAGTIFGLGVLGLVDKEHTSLAQLAFIGIALLIFPRVVKYVVETSA